MEVYDMCETRLKNGSFFMYKLENTLQKAQHIQETTMSLLFIPAGNPNYILSCS